jgi:hypothetical protein
MDQKQIRLAAIPRTRVGKGANGNVVGLPHLQLAALDRLEEPIQHRGNLKTQTANPH